jgi:hypothetical protein
METLGNHRVKHSRRSRPHPHPGHTSGFGLIHDANPERQKLSVDEEKD